MRTTPGAPTGGDMPQMNYGRQYAGPKKLFFSHRDSALIVGADLKPGYGVLLGGQILAVNSADNKLCPYIPDVIVLGETKGVAPIIANIGNGDTTCYVPMDDSYKFEVGDSLILFYSSGNQYDGGAITAIDRTTDNWRAKITFTNAVSGTSYSTANSAGCHLKSKSTSKYSQAKYILDIDVDTGYGYNEGVAPTGAQASIVLSNALLYRTSLVDYDSQAATDMSATTYQNLLILK